MLFVLPPRLLVTHRFTTPAVLLSHHFVGFESACVGRTRLSTSFELMVCVWGTLDMWCSSSWSGEMSETVGQQKDLGRSDIYNVVFIRWAAFGF